MEIALFKKTRELDNKINEFFNNVSEAGLVYVRAITLYLENGASEEFAQKRQEVSAFEARNDQLRRDVEAQLYEHTLLPDSRADVLELLEGVDKVINKYEANLYMYEIETTSARILYIWYLDDGDNVDYPAGEVTISPK